MASSKDSFLKNIRDLTDINKNLKRIQDLTDLNKLLQIDQMSGLFAGSRPTVLQEVSVSPLNFTSYKKLIPPDLYEEVLALAKPLRGEKIVMINATAYGGGVAEIFKSMVPLMHSIGLDVHWHIMPPNDDFFVVTKAFHNALQGADYELTDVAKNTYLRHNEHTAKMMTKLGASIYEIHDPQPAAVNQFYNMGKTIWRCHIDTSTPNQQVWEFVRPFIEEYDELIFTMPEYVHGSLKEKSVHYIAPTIDPLSIKNIPLSRDFARTVVEAVGVDPDRPLITQVSRFDPWKDPEGVIDVYRRVKKHVPKVQLALVGSMASDDPEGHEIMRNVMEYAAGDPDIYIFTNLTGVGEIEVNAFQTHSDVVLQKSIREGFGLTVAEGMWKRRPVIGAAVGGITLQIENGVSGFLINSNEECADRIVEIIKDPRLSSSLASQAHARVSEQFLHPRLIRDHLKLYHKMLKI